MCTVHYGDNNLGGMCVLPIIRGVYRPVRPAIVYNSLIIIIVCPVSVLSETKKLAVAIIAGGYRSSTINRDKLQKNVHLNGTRLLKTTNPTLIKKI